MLSIKNSPEEYGFQFSKAAMSLSASRILPVAGLLSHIIHRNLIQAILTAMTFRVENENRFQSLLINGIGSLSIPLLCAIDRKGTNFYLMPMILPSACYSERHAPGARGRSNCSSVLIGLANIGPTDRRTSIQVSFILSHRPRERYRSTPRSDIFHMRVTVPSQ